MSDRPDKLPFNGPFFDRLACAAYFLENGCTSMPGYAADVQQVVSHLPSLMDELQAAKDEIARFNAIYHSPIGDNHHNAARCPYCSPDFEAQAAEVSALKAQLAAMREALKPFTDLRAQRGAWCVFSKKLDGMSPMTVTVTKAQMLAACKALAGVMRKRADLSADPPGESPDV
jgi:hypothetical protein